MTTKFEVIIIGGSYAGLAAAMALGRALKSVLIIDEGKPCNKQTPYSHNFLTNDGKSPAEIAALANLQVSRYETVKRIDQKATQTLQTDSGFDVIVESGESFSGGKIIFATGIKDLLPDIVGIQECWGISVLHCPYCHGYEVRNTKTGILGSNQIAFDFTALISNWTKDLIVFTNGHSAFSDVQRESLQQNQIIINEDEIERLKHEEGDLKSIVFKNGSEFPINTLYAPSPFDQHCKIPEALGCSITEEGYLKIDENFETSIPGIYAIGDNASKMRTVANTVGMGTAAGMMISKKMILEKF